MPFCPECQYEYVKGIIECPDCQIKLVQDLSNEEDTFDPDMELVPLHSLPGAVYAEMVKEALQNEGIESLTKSDIITSAIGSKGLGLAGQSSQIFVRKKDKDKAERILHEMLNHI